uniref:uncharacterized protein n=1 Tax=Calcarisporiella thermophila TaxID=911321 RepID=UPI00374453C3
MTLTPQSKAAVLSNSAISSSTLSAGRKKLDGNNMSQSPWLEGKSLVDFNSMDINILRKYRRIHRVRTRAKPTRDELVEAVKRHFAALPVREIDAVTYFLYAVQNKDKILKLPPPI